MLNGSQGFGKRQLVYGDRIQIPGFEYYTFVYAGGRLRHVGRRGLIQARGLCVDVPGRRILDAVDLDIQPGELVGILGGSGQGKSTLMNALCGLNPANVGEVRLDGVALSDRSRIAELGTQGREAMLVAHPIFIVVFVIMWFTAATELGTGQWISNIYSDVMGKKEGILALVWGSILMYILRQFFSKTAHKISPFALIALTAPFAAVAFVTGRQSGG